MIKSCFIDSNETYLYFLTTRVNPLNTSIGLTVVNISDVSDINYITFKDLYWENGIWSIAINNNLQEYVYVSGKSASNNDGKIWRYFHSSLDLTLDWIRINNLDIPKMLMHTNGDVLFMISTDKDRSNSEIATFMSVDFDTTQSHYSKYIDYGSSFNSDLTDPRVCFDQASNTLYMTLLFETGNKLLFMDIDNGSGNNNVRHLLSNYISWYAIRYHEDKVFSLCTKKTSEISNIIVYTIQDQSFAILESPGYSVHGMSIETSNNRLFLGMLKPPNPYMTVTPVDFPNYQSQISYTSSVSSTDLSNSNTYQVLDSGIFGISSSTAEIYLDPGIYSPTISYPTPDNIDVFYDLSKLNQ